jgi:hypothetical protein
MEPAHFHQQTLLSLVEWNTILSNSKEIYQGLFSSITGVPHHLYHNHNNDPHHIMCGTSRGPPVVTTHRKKTLRKYLNNKTPKPITYVCEKTPKLVTYVCSEKTPKPFYHMLKYVMYAKVLHCLVLSDWQSLSTSLVGSLLIPEFPASTTNAKYLCLSSLESNSHKPMGVEHMIVLVTCTPQSEPTDCYKLPSDKQKNVRSFDDAPIRSILPSNLWNGSWHKEGPY